jgi:hypothetical protein
MDCVVLTKVSSAVDLNVAAVKATFSFCESVKIVAAGVLVRTNVAQVAVVKFSKASAGASITASGNVAIINVPVSVIGKIIYDDLDDSSVEVAAGQEVQVEVTTDPTATLSAVAFVKYTVIDEHLQNESRAVLTA